MPFIGYIALTLLGLALLGWASTARGARLWIILFVFGWTTGQFNPLLEAVIFSVMPLRGAAIELAIALVALAMMTALAVTLVGKWRGTQAPTVRLNLNLTTLITVIVGYQILYFGAGALVWPFVAKYYLAKGLLPQALVMAVQVPRALIFTIPAILWLRTQPKYAPFILGAAYALIGAIAPLIPDNPYMPAAIRFAHGIETGSVNFVFGLLVGWVLENREFVLRPVTRRSSLP